MRNYFNFLHSHIKFSTYLKFLGYLQNKANTQAITTLIRTTQIPDEFDNRCREINKKERKDNNVQTKKFLPEMLMIKESWNLIGPEAHPTKSVSLKCYLPLVVISMSKIKHINWSFPVTLLIKELYVLIGWETQMITTNQKW